jgi:formylglycine-generating enzyme required for sulfatase activity
MAIYETTYWQYNLFCKATGYQNKVQSKIMQGDHPVEYATWYDAIRYVNWLNKQLGLDKFYSIDSKGTAGLFGDFYHVRWNAGAKRGFRLPTEAEWEFAAKGGTTPENTLYSGSNNLGLVGWYNENSGFGPHAVGQKRANVLGLYDMSGNVWEWCWDSWTEGEKETSVKGLNGQRIQKYHVIRGGTWSYDAVDCQVGSRSYSEGPSFSNLIGFRVVYLE